MMAPEKRVAALSVTAARKDSLLIQGVTVASLRVASRMLHIFNAAQ